MDGQNPHQQNHGGNGPCENARSHKSGQVIVTPQTRDIMALLGGKKPERVLQRPEETGLSNTGKSTRGLSNTCLPNISGSTQIGSEQIRGSEHVVRDILPNIQNIRKREDDSILTPRADSSGTQPLAYNRTPNIGGTSMNTNASASQIVFDNSDANRGAEGSGTPRQGGPGRIASVATASSKVSHSQFATGIAAPNVSHNTAPRFRFLKQPRSRVGDPIICVCCMDSQGMESSCPKCGKHNNENARRCVPGERPDLPINDEIASGSVPGSPRVGSASVRSNPESPIQAEETVQEFQYNSGHGAPGNQRVASAQAQIAAQLPGRFGNHASNSLSSGSNAASLTSEQNRNSEMQPCTSTNTEDANRGGISTQQSRSSREVTPRMRGFGNGMHLGKTPGFLGNLSRAIQSNSSASLSQLENNNSAVNRSSGVGDTVSPASGHVGSSAIRWLFGGRRIVLSSKQQRGRTDLGTGTGSPDSVAPGTQQGMEPVAPSMPSGRHRAGGNFANAYANANGGGYTNANGFVTNANGYPRANSAGYPGNANGGYPNGAYSNGCQSSVGVGTHGNQGKDDRISDPMYLIYPHDSASVGDEENNKNNAARALKNLQANLYDKELEERVISNSQIMGTQNMDRQNAGLTGYSYEQVVSNPVSYHPLKNQMDAHAGSVQGMQSGMQGMEDYPGMSEDRIDSQTGSQNRGSQTHSQGMSGGRSSKKSSVMSRKIPAQEWFSTLKSSLREARKSTENANSMNAAAANGQKDSFKEQQFQNQIESSSASRSPPAPSMHTPITHTPNIPPTSMHMPTANNMHSVQVAQQQALTLQQAQQENVADAVARQQLKMKAERELEVERVKPLNMAVIRASQKLGSAPQKSKGGTSSRQERVDTLPRLEGARTSPRQERDGEFENRDEMIAAPRGEKRKSPKDSSKSKTKNKRQSSQHEEQEQNAFKEQGQEAGFQLSKQDGSTQDGSTQAGSTQAGSRGPQKKLITAGSNQTLSSGISGSISFTRGDSADSRFAQGNPGDGGWANVPAGANGNDVAVETRSYKDFGDSHFDPCQNSVSSKSRAVVNRKSMNFRDGMDNGLNFNGIYAMSITAPIKRNGVPLWENHNGVSGSPYKNNTQVNKECEDYCNDLLNSVDLNKVSGLVNSSAATNNNNNEALNLVDAVNSVRSIVPVNNVNVNIAQVHKVPTPRSSIQGDSDSLVAVNRALDELEKAKEQELLVYSRDNSIDDGVGFRRRRLSPNDPLAYMIDSDDSASDYDRSDAYTGCDGIASHCSGSEYGCPGISHPSQPDGASSGPQSPDSGSHDPNDGLKGRNFENRRDMGWGNAM